MIPQATERLGIKTKLMVDPITMHLAQNIVKPSLYITLGVELFCGGIQLFDNFTLCNLNYFDIIIGNTFLDGYEINILYNKNKVKVRTKVGSKLMNLNGNHNSLLEKIGINLVVFIKELKSFCFMILMSLKISQEEPNLQGARWPLDYILDSLNKFLEVLTNELPDFFPPCKEVDHKIKIVLDLAPPSKAPYRLNQKELEKLKKN
jgi:hypothetical protein